MTRRKKRENVSSSFLVTIRVFEKFLFSVKVDPCSSGKVGNPLLVPDRCFVSPTATPPLPGGVENRTRSHEPALHSTYFASSNTKLLSTVYVCTYHTESPYLRERKPEWVKEHIKSSTVGYKG
jgi:hypothetical protein